MSINHFIDENQQPKLDLYANNIQAKKVSVEEEFDELKFKCQNGDVVNLSTLLDKGIGGYRLTSDGDGSVSWTEGAGSSGVDYNGNDPVAIGKLAIYGATNGKLIKDSNLSDTDILNKNGDTMNGSLDMNNNNINNVNTARVNIFEPNPSIDPFSVGFNAENVSFNTINTTCNGLAGQEITWRFTRQGVNYGEFGTEPNIFYFGNFNNPAVNTEIRGANNEKLVIDDSAITPECRLENLNLNLTNGTIDNVSNVDTAILTTDTISSNNPSIDVLFTDLNMNNGDILGVSNITTNNVYTKTLFATTPATEIQVENNLRMRGNDIVDVDNIDVNIGITTQDIKTNTITTNTTGNISFNNNIILFSNNILAGGNIQTSSLSATDTKSQEIDTNAHLDFDTLYDVRNVKTLTSTNVDTQTTSTAVLNGGINPDIDVNANLDFDNLYEIKDCLNITTQDINTNTITSNAPNTEINLGANTNLNLNGNSIIGLDTINGLQAGGGLYSESSGFSTASTTEINLLGQGASSGSLSVPANTFTSLSMFSFKASGVLSGGTNDLFTIRARTNTDIPSNVILGEIMVSLQDNGLVNVAWDIMIDFTIRTIGVAGVAELVLSGAFRYTNNNDVVRTFLRTIVLNTGFDTTASNELELTFQNDAIDPLTNFRIDQASFTKWF